MANLFALRDNFSDNSVANAWTDSTSGSATAAETGGQFRATLPSSTAGTHLAYRRSEATYDATASSFYINIETMVSTSVAATAFFDLLLDGTNYLRWRQLSGAITARSVVAGVDTQHFTAAWSAATYKYLRIRESGGNILFESSTNGTSWTNRATIAAPFPVTGIYVQFGVQCGNIATPGSFRLDDVNLILPALSTTWRYQWGRWPLTNRHKRVTIAIDAADTVQGYLVTADGVDASGEPSGNVRYWSGPAHGGRELTQQADQASAEAMAVNLPLNGSFDLPEQIDARYFRLYDRSIDGAAFLIREFFPRRLVQSDDIEAESIRAINIAASAITVDKLDVLLTMTGRTIQTAYNGARVVLSGDTFGGFIGYGATDTYDPLTGAGTYQVLWKLTDGKFYAGAGAVTLDSAGITVEADTTAVFSAVRSYKFLVSGAEIGGLYAFDSAAGNLRQLYLVTQEGTARDSSLTLASAAISGRVATASISAGHNNPPTTVAPRVLMTHSGSVNTIEVGGTGGGTTTTIYGGLNVGTSTGATAGQVKASASVQSLGASAGFVFEDRTSGDDYQWYGTGSLIRLFDGTQDVLQVTPATAVLNLSDASAELRINGTKVVDARITGWTAPSGTGLRTTFATTTVTTEQLAQRVKGLIDDLISHGLIGT